jgi:hypothetical protein
MINPCRWETVFDRTGAISISNSLFTTRTHGSAAQLDEVRGKGLWEVSRDGSLVAGSGTAGSRSRGMRRLEMYQAPTHGRYIAGLIVPGRPRTDIVVFEEASPMDSVSDERSCAPVFPVSTRPSNAPTARAVEVDRFRPPFLDRYSAQSAILKYAPDLSVCRIQEAAS